jgi:uncharacterized membrane protein
MNDDDTDSGGDFFMDLMKTLIALFVFILFIVVMGSIVGGLLSWFQ